MSIFRKIFNKVQPKMREHVLRPLRLRISPLHKVTFKLEESEHVLPVYNLSMTGLALAKTEDFKGETHQVLRGVLVLDRRHFNLELEIRHITPHIVGCQIVKSDEAYRRAVPSFFKIEILGMSLKRVDETYLQEEVEGETKRHWFTDGHANELFYTSDEKGMIGFHMTFLGNYLEGGRDQSLRGGHVIEENVVDEADAAKHKSSSLVDLQNKPDIETLSAARSLVQTIPDILETDRRAILKSLT